MSVKFKIDGIQYQTPASLDDIKAGLFVQYAQDVLTKQPAELAQIYEAENAGGFAEAWENMQSEARLVCYGFFAEVVAFWSGCDAQKIKNALSLEQLLAAWLSIEILFLSFEPAADFAGFDFDGVAWCLPSQNMTDATFIEFAEASQFEANAAALGEGNFGALLDVMAILCRPAGEIYDADKLPERKKIFSSAPLSVALNVSFFLTRLNAQLWGNLAIYSALKIKTAAEVAEAERLARSGGTLH